MMDNTQYDKKFTNRNRIIVPRGWIWITVPIKKEHKFLPNRLVEINNKISWRENHWEKIQHSYGGAKFFKLYRDYFKDLYKKEWELLFDLNFETLKKTIEWLGIKIEIIRESELNVKGKETERLVNICKSIGADTYISGAGGKNYMQEELFMKNEIKLLFQNYSCVKYQQHQSATFVPDLSIIDLLANVGPNSLSLLRRMNRKIDQ